MIESIDLYRWISICIPKADILDHVSGYNAPHLSCACYVVVVVVVEFPGGGPNKGPVLFPENVMEKLSMSSVRKIDFTIIIIIKLFSLIVSNRDYG